MVATSERQWVSQYSAEYFAMIIQSLGGPVDADGDVLVTMVDEDYNDDVFVGRQATSLGITGHYQIPLYNSDTQSQGPFSLIWTWELDGQPEAATGYILIGEPAPAYDALTDDMKFLVDQAWIRFADSFDSVNGGPNLQEYYQAHFTRGRMAQLLRIAVGRLNTMAQPHQTYTIDGDGGATFPLEQWGSILENALYVECIRHLIRSYTEQPLFMQGAGQITRLDRRDYMDRWRSVLKDEEAVLKGQLDVFKIANMGLGKPRTLVSGGVYGRYGPTRIAGSVAARPRYFTRWY